jgi:hypothetical protein
MNIYLNGLIKSQIWSYVYRKKNDVKRYDPDGVVHLWALLLCKTLNPFEIINYVQD